MGKMRSAEKRPADDEAVTAPSTLEVTHHRNRLAGIWAAELLGLFGHAAQDYIRTVVHPDHRQEAVHGDDHDKVLGKLARDLAGRASIAEIRDKMAHFLAEARRQIRHDRRR